MSVYVVSDLHGQFDVLKRGLEMIGFSEEDRLIVLGDVIDRGPHGIRMLKFLMQHENMDMILGNHEFMMLNSVDSTGKRKCNGQDSLLWMVKNGGEVTWNEYGKESERRRKKILRYLRTRNVIKTVMVGEQRYLLTHSYYIKGCEDLPYTEIPQWKTRQIVWTSVYRKEGSREMFQTYRNEDAIFITGHVPIQVVKRQEGNRHGTEDLIPFVRENFMDIDGGLSAGKKDWNAALFVELLEDTTITTAVPSMP